MQPERRKHVRILTIRNFAVALFVMVIALVTANVISEMRAPRHGEYGRLTIEAKPVSVKPPAIVTEAEIPDETPVGPSPSLLSGAPAASPAQQRGISAGEPAGAPPNRAAMSDHV